MSTNGTYDHLTTGQLIRQIRRRLNITQKQLAEKAGIHMQTVWNAENNMPMRTSTLDKICDAFTKEINDKTKT